MTQVDVTIITNMESIDQTHKSFCLFCISECGTQVDISDNKIIKIRPDPLDPVSQGYVCEKSQKIKQYQEDPDRILSPLKRVNGELQPISWNQALSEIATKLRDTIDRGRRDRIFYMPVLSPNYDSNALYLYELMGHLGSRYMTNILSVEKIYQLLAVSKVYDRTLISDPENSETLLIFGQNTWNINPFPRSRIILNEIRNDPNKRIVTIDPCDNETTQLADLHIRLKPGTDSWLILALLRFLSDKDYLDQKFIDDNVINHERILDTIRNVDVQEYLDVAGVSMEELESLAEIIHGTKAMSIHSGNGVCHSLFPMATYYLLTILPILLGQVNVKGTLMHEPGFLVRQPYFKESSSPFTNKLQIDGIMGAGEAVENLFVDDDRKFDVIITDNCNPIARYPNTKKVREQFKKVGFHVALDSFMSDTTRVADYVLPTPTFLERYECVNAVPDRGWIQLNRPVLAPPEESRTSWQIYEELLDRVGLIDDVLISKSQQEYATDPVRFIEQLLSEFNGEITTVLYRLDKTLGKRFNDPLFTMVWWQLFIYNRRYLATTEEAYHRANDQIEEFIETGKLNLKQNGYQDAPGKFDLNQDLYTSVLKLKPDIVSDTTYQFMVMPGIRQRGNLNMIVRNREEPYAEMNQTDAEKLMVHDDDMIQIITQNGDMIIPIKKVNTIPIGVIRLYNNRDLNFITDSTSRDHLNPRYKFQFANVKSVAKKPQN